MIDLLIVIPSGGISEDVPMPSNDIVFLDVVTATGAIDIIVGGVTFKRAQGDTITLSSPFRSVRLAGAPQTVRLSVGNAQERASHAPSGGGGAVTISGPLPLPVDVTDGQYQLFSATTPTAASPSPVFGGLFAPGMPGQAIPKPLSATSSTTSTLYPWAAKLLTGFDDAIPSNLISLAPGFATNPIVDTNGMTAVRLHVTVCAPGDVMTVRGYNNNAVPIYEVNKGIWIPLGIIREPGIYDVPTLGIGPAFSVVCSGANSGNVNFFAYAGALGSSPVTMTAPIAANSLNVTTANPLSTTTVLVPAVNGRQVKIFGYSYSFRLPVDAQLQDTSGGPLTVKALGITSGGEVDVPVAIAPRNLGVQLVISSSVEGSVSLRYQVD
jgi:hypothetical protein